MAQYQESIDSEKPVQSTKDLKFLKAVSLSKFPIYLVQAISTGKFYVMKSFPFNEGKISPVYLLECLFCAISHPNIISYIQGKSKAKMILNDNQKSNVSYILMEWAPYGDFYRLFFEKKLPTEEKLARTLFHQMISGLKFLHARGIAHMDLKPANLVLGENYTMKLMDFGLSCYFNDKVIRSKGSPNFRAPEVKANSCGNPEKADIYSAGILLFVLRLGSIPYIEDQMVGKHNLFELLMEKDDEFWDIHLNNTNSEDFDQVEPSFKSLFFSMVDKEADKRPSVHDIEKSDWYKGPIYTEKELAFILSKHVKPICNLSK
jgi:serine/threonine protein kinase